VVQSAAPEQAQALRDALYELRHADPETLIRLNQQLAEALAGNRANAEAGAASCMHDTWTETIDRPDDDRFDPDRDPDLTELHDPFADVPLPPLNRVAGA
jgi:hypothetical protein